MSRLLLDTHALVWWFLNDPRTSESARAAIVDETSTVYVSAASSWEIATKARVKRDQAMATVADRYNALVDRNAFVHLPVTHVHGLRAGSYTVAHRDPFDRMLAAQGELENLTLVTRDRAFGHFGVATLW